jgi:hypothetical protein
MAKRRIEAYPDQAYPTLRGWACGRRAFLGRLAMGAAAVGAARILAACESTLGISGRPGELYEVRLPESGFAGAYLGFEDYLLFAVVIGTRDEALASWYEGAREEGTSLCASTLHDFRCDDIGSEPVREALRTALEEGYATGAGAAGTGIVSLELIVESCEYIPTPEGDWAGPDYP